MGASVQPPRIAFLWHLHQPPYRDPETGTFLLPWVRLHGTRGYLDLAEIHLRFPGVRSTVNFSPILLEQLEAYADGTARDRFLDLSRASAEDLSEGERIFLLERSFMVSWEQGVKPLSRYWELLQKRGTAPVPEELPRIARTFSPEEIRDLQVLSQLAWMGFAARARSEVVRALLAKGRDFSEEEKEALFTEQQRLLALVLPLWREVAEVCDVELSASPYAHPILPLLCDTDVARVALPQIALPPRLRARDDAVEQVRRGREVHERIFGSKPRGMWPSEGSVSPEALEVLREQGVEWAASDEEVLLRSLPKGVERQLLYRPWKVRAGDGSLHMVFRDRSLSDRVGFVYSRANPRQAVDDLLGEVSRIGREGRERSLVPIILDGENPWEYYPSSGEEFLTELYARLERGEGGIGTVTLSQTLDEGLPAGDLGTIHAGSWIEGSFRIWMGHEEDVAAWTLLGKAKRAVAEAKAAGEAPAALAAAERNLLLAEASDWFWWYGEDFLTETRTDFDLLFRHFVQATFLALGREPPMESRVPLIPEGRSFGEALVAKEPVGFIRPKLDGRTPSYWEWLGAGLILSREALGQSMYHGERPFERMYFGFDHASLYLRLDPGRGREPASELDGFGLELRVEGREVEIGGTLSAGRIDFRRGNESVGRGSMEEIVELALPFSALGLEQGQRIGFALRVMKDHLEIQRMPEQGFLAIDVPGPGFEEALWKV